VLRSLYLPIHLFLAVFGYGALFAAFTMGVLYLFQERELLSRSPRRFYYLIPSLERSDTIGWRSVPRRLRLPDPGDRHRPAVEPQPARPLLDGGPEGVGGRRGVDHLRGDSRREGARGLGRAPRGLARHRGLRGRGVHVTWATLVPAVAVGGR